MTQRRFLSLWFSRLGAERFLRLENDLADLPFAILQESGQAQRLSSLSRSAFSTFLRLEINSDTSNPPKIEAIMKENLTNSP